MLFFIPLYRLDKYGQKDGGVRSGYSEEKHCPCDDLEKSKPEHFFLHDIAIAEYNGTVYGCSICTLPFCRFFSKQILLDHGRIFRILKE